MLADPRTSRVVLINPARGQPGDQSSRPAARWHDSLAMLAAAVDILGVHVDIIGHYDATLFPHGLARAVTSLAVDALSLWRDPDLVAALQASGVSAIFFGGVFLDEEVLIAALEGVRLGYDVRLLADLSLARDEADRSLVLDRLALHGVLATTVRQALLEWAVCRDDAVLIKRIELLFR
jgi:hypothetical protein